MDLDAALDRLASDPFAPLDGAAAVDGAEDVLFDPFRGGHVLTNCDCAQLVQRVTGRPFAVTAQDLEPIPAGLLLRRARVEVARWN